MGFTIVASSAAAISCNRCSAALIESPNPLNWETAASVRAVSSSKSLISFSCKKHMTCAICLRLKRGNPLAGADIKSMLEYSILLCYNIRETPNTNFLWMNIQRDTQWSAIAPTTASSSTCFLLAGTLRCVEIIDMEYEHESVYHWRSAFAFSDEPRPSRVVEADIIETGLNGQ